MFRYSQVLSKTGKTLRGARQSSQVAHQPVTMSEVPVPSGSWAAHNEAMQKRYNNHLYGGIAFSAFTLYMVGFPSFLITIPH